MRIIDESRTGVLKASLFCVSTRIGVVQMTLTHDTHTQRLIRFGFWHILSIREYMGSHVSMAHAHGIYIYNIYNINIIYMYIYAVVAMSR